MNYFYLNFFSYFYMAYAISQALIVLLLIKLSFFKFTSFGRSFSTSDHGLVTKQLIIFLFDPLTQFQISNGESALKKQQWTYV